MRPTNGGIYGLVPLNATSDSVALVWFQEDPNQYQRVEVALGTGPWHIASGPGAFSSDFAHPDFFIVF